MTDSVTERTCWIMILNMMQTCRREQLDRVCTSKLIQSNRIEVHLRFRRLMHWSLLKCTPLPEPPVPSPLAPPSKSSSKIPIIIGCVVGGLGVIILAFIACLLCFKPKLAGSILSRELLKADSEASMKVLTPQTTNSDSCR